MSSEPNMPMGMLRRGFWVSCAAVLMASKPKKAKNTMAAPRNMPDQPYSPNTPVFCGTRGVRLSVLMYLKPTYMKMSTTAIFNTTRKSLNFELPLVPRISMNDSSTMSNVAGRLNTPPSAGQAVQACGRCHPRSLNMMVK